MTQFDAFLARRSFGVVLFAAFLVVWALLTKVHTHSWQEESRMATVQTLVEQGTFIIDHTEFNRTGDKVFVNGHFYSDKTPILSVAAAGAYSILHNIFGLTLDPTICVPDEDPSACRAFTPNGTRFTAFYWLTLIFIGGSSALLVVLFWRAMIDRGAGGLLSTALAMALGLASPIAPYSIVFAGHVPAALCLFAGFVLLCHSEPRSGEESLSNRTETSCFARNDSRRVFFAGLLISLSANIDLTLALFVIAFGAWVLMAHRWKVLPLVIGAIVPVAMSAAINYWAAGTITPMYLDPKAYDFVGTVLNPTVGGTNGFYSLEFGAQYTYNILIGRRGFFAFTPMLIYAVVGLAMVMRDRANRLRGLSFAVAAGCLAFAAYLILRTDNYGGEAWGTRWFVPLVPLLWFYAPVAYHIWPIANRTGVVWRVVFWLVMLISLATALLGIYDAWRDVPPLVRL
jgi:hypothetical protein